MWLVGREKAGGRRQEEREGRVCGWWVERRDTGGESEEGKRERGQEEGEARGRGGKRGGM